MPYMMIRTNAEIADPGALMSRSSAFLSEKLGKPEAYIMIALEPKTDMMFAGTSGVSAYVELKSIGLTDARTTELSESVCGFLDKELGVGADRVYVEFAGVPAAMWGWNNRTFG